VKLILASASPRRRELLEAAALKFDVVTSDVEEVRGHGEEVHRYVERLALEKAGSVARRHPGAWVIAADTVVWLEGEVLEKPTDRAHAIEMLERIAGRQHVVYTATALVNEELGWERVTVTTTEVEMVRMQPEEIEWYVDTGEPMDKAGSYAVQGIGAMFIDAVRGNYTNVVGLPLSTLFGMMRDAGIDPAHYR
jgi:septum formation protein